MDNDKSYFDIKAILERVIHVLNEKMDSFIESKKENEPNYNKHEFFKNDVVTFPMSRDSYYKYTSFVNQNGKGKKVQSIDLRIFYDICTYTDVSADYLLGFITTKRKEASAEKVKNEFGLSDKAMERLRTIKINTENKDHEKGDLTSNLLNFILENDLFWGKIEDRLPVYLSCLHYRMASIDYDMIRFGVIRAFEELIDDICNYFSESDLPFAELDAYSTFPSKKIEIGL